MFTILPTSGDFCKDDAEWFTDLEQAYDSAFEWSVELHGATVNVYEHYAGKFKKIAEVFA
jgi:hypothetical protein